MVKRLVRIVWSFSLVMSVAWAGGLSAASAADGKAVFGSKKCGDCHQSASGKVKSIEDRQKMKGPDLWYAGSKFKKDWLEGWLKGPKPIRQVKWNTLDKGTNPHPSLSAGEAKDVAEYLATLVDKQVSSGAVPEGELKGAAKIKGKNLFEKKQGCYGCHKTKAGAKEIGGFTGPSLVDAGSRLKGDWVYAYLKDTERFEPKGRSPNYKGVFSDDEAKTLAQYLTSFK